MDEIKIPVLLCDYLNRMPSRGGVSFIPEVWRDGDATVRLTGGVSAAREYIDGSKIMAREFEIRVRCSHESIERRLRAVDLFAEIDAYVRKTSVMSGEDEIGSVIPTGGSFKSAVYENGDEEYRAAYSFRYFTKA